MSSNIEMFNEHQKDTRNRADSLIKAILIMAGGSLTVSIGLFLQEDRIPLSNSLLVTINISWWLLFSAIIFGVLTLYTIIMRDYYFGERCRKYLGGNDEVDTSGTPGNTEKFILIFGHLGVFSFVLGMLFLAYVATQAIH